MPSKLSLAVKCQLLIGGFAGSKRQCDCGLWSECKLTENERTGFRSHDLVNFCLNRHGNEYQEKSKKS